MLLVSVSVRNEMTITVKTEKIGNIQINLELSKHGFYKVFVYEYGKTIKDNQRVASVYGQGKSRGDV